MGTKDARIDASIAKSANFAKPVLNHIRKLVHAACPDVEETMKWSLRHSTDCLEPSTFGCFERVDLRECCRALHGLKPGTASARSISGRCRMGMAPLERETAGRWLSVLDTS